MAETWGNWEHILYAVAVIAYSTTQMTQLLSPRELAALLSLKEQTIYNRHSTGGSLPPCLKIGNRLRFRQSDVEVWIAAQIQLPPTLFPISREAELLAPRRRGRPTKAQQVALRKVESSTGKSGNR
jgi:predicted DNA-binding transcriptional regulator AlpA